MSEIASEVTKADIEKYRADNDVDIEDMSDKAVIKMILKERASQQKIQQQAQQISQQEQKIKKQEQEIKRSKKTFAQLVEEEIEILAGGKKPSRDWLSSLDKKKRSAEKPSECFISVSNFTSILHKTDVGADGFDYSQILELRGYVRSNARYSKAAVWNTLCHLAYKGKKLTEEQSEVVCGWLGDYYDDGYRPNVSNLYEKIFSVMCGLTQVQAELIFRFCGDNFDENHQIKRLVDNGSWNLNTYRAVMDSLEDGSADAKFLTGIFRMLKDNRLATENNGIKKFGDADLDRLLAKVDRPNTFPGGNNSIFSYIFFHYTGKTYDEKTDIEKYDNASQFSKSKLLEFFVRGCTPESVSLKDFCGAGLKFYNVEQKDFSNAVIGIKKISGEDDLKFVVRGKEDSYRKDLKTEDLYNLSKRLDFSVVNRKGSEDAFGLFLKSLITSVTSRQAPGPDCVSGAIRTLLYFVHGERYKFNDLLALFAKYGFRAEYFNEKLSDKALYTFLVHCHVKPNSSEFEKGILSDKDIKMLHGWLKPGAQLSVKTAVELTRKSIDFWKLDKAREEKRKKTGKVEKLTAVETLGLISWHNSDCSLDSLKGKDEEFSREFAASLSAQGEQHQEIYQPRPRMEEEADIETPFLTAETL